MKTKPTLLVVALAVSTTISGIFAAEEVQALPAIAQESTINASLQAVKKNLRERRFKFQREAQANGRANASTERTTLDSCHRIECATPDVAEKVQKWARTHGFKPSELITLLSHGSAEIYFVDVRKTCGFDAPLIHKQCKRIHAGIQQIEGATYADWCPQIEE